MTVILLEIDSTQQENVLSIKLSREEEHGTFRFIKVGKLPQVPQELHETYHQWSCIYQNSYANRIKPSVEQLTYLTDDYDEWRQKVEQNQDIEEKLKKYINKWLDDISNEEWRQVRDLIVANIQKDIEQEEVIVIVRSQDQNLLKLPWHLWNVFDDRNIEVCLSWGIKTDKKVIKKQKEKVNILVIISEDQNLNTSDEERLWNDLKSSSVNVEVLRNPKQHTFATLWTQNWDILYYAGHSLSSSEVFRF
jgi:CHAT domain-containing protein